MCGIAGFISSNRDQIDKRARLLESMCRMITHRGPDEQGTVVRGRAALGMRRLSIIDLRTGQQPIFSPDERFAIVFNGEIYNYRELKANLEGKGFQFRTNSDTETILYAYQHYGSRCVEHLRGMFAFAIWDFVEESLFIARDRVGKKPLFYGTAPDGSFLFGSELKSPLLYPNVDRSIDPRALNAYITFGYVPEDLCIFKAFHKLHPGHTLTYAKGKITTEQYWDFPLEEDDPPRREGEYVEQLREAIKDAVKVRLVSEVPLGAFLSGGIDSSTVVAFMSQLSSEAVKTFSIGFNEDSFNELKFARIAAKHFGTDHHEFIVEPNIVELVDELVWHFDEPFADSSALPTYAVSKMARDHVTVVLSGDGGDEVFGGYTRYATHQKRRFLASAPSGLRGQLRKLASRLPESTLGKNYLHNISLDPAGQYIDRVSLWNEPRRRRLYSKDFLNSLDEDFDHPERDFRRIVERAGTNPAKMAMYLDSKTYLPGDIMTKVDRMSMANSIEARSPLLDHKLIETASKIPMKFKLKGNETKYILKKSMEGIVPSDTLYREKQGFGVPIIEWINGMLRGRISGTLLANDTKTSEYFDRSFVKDVLDEHERKRRDNSHLLWTLFMLETWFRKM